MVSLAPAQINAVRKLKNGNILNGGVGSGKSRTAIYYYLSRVCGAEVRVNGAGNDGPPKQSTPLYIITTVKKRDGLEWEAELANFGISKGDVGDVDDRTGATVVIDSWNRIARYADVKGAFFIFDEQRLVGSGAWVKAFLKIAKSNQWIILSATPGDTWADYIPVFVANGFYKNRSELLERHAVYNTFANYPKIDRWVEEGRLQVCRRALLVEMPVVTHTKRHILTKPVEYDKELWNTVRKDRWNPWTNEPIQDAGELFRCMRRVANQDPSRLEVVKAAIEKKSKVIVFYNFNYEREMLYGLESQLTHVDFAEWSGHKHMKVPETDSWIYLVQYTAGSEGWNCISTDTVLFYSLTYSWKAFEQAQGRIDRMNTPYKDLYYWVLRGQSEIDKIIWHSLHRKKNFNETAYAKQIGF